jgi:hypothetical protein
MPYIETVVLPYGFFTVRTDGKTYSLNYDNLVVYENGKRKVRGRLTPYEFKSVEKMRYDFERDVESL